MHVLSLLLALFSSYFLLLSLIPLLSRYCPDMPNRRSSHSRITPRGGGIVFVLIAIFSSLFLFLFNETSFIYSSPAFLPFLALPLSLVGLVDDLHGVSPAFRYSVQFITALLIVIHSPLVMSDFPALPLLVLLLICITAVINFTNFMDGLDGLVAGCLMIVIFTTALKLAAPSPVWALVGALLGFLFLNWSPASVFMGDVGSTFLGAVFAGLVLHAPSWLDAIGLLLIATPLLGDALFCVLRRLFSRQPVFQSHRLHLFQRLHQGGWSHSRVSSLYIMATALLGVSLLFGDLPLVLGLAIAELLVGVFLDQRVAFPFSLASQS